MLTIVFYVSNTFFLHFNGRLVVALTRQCTPVVEAWAAAAATWVLVAQDHTISVSRTDSFMLFHFMKHPRNYITTVSSCFSWRQWFLKIMACY